MPHAHISLVTLGVSDVPRAARFYEALGFTRKVRAAPEHEVAFFDAGRRRYRFMQPADLRATQASRRTLRLSLSVERRSPGTAPARPRSMP
jgi:catechol 2,3-dioxygenase-like lactoylglutathione lyase family enzyme